MTTVSMGIFSLFKRKTDETATSRTGEASPPAPDSRLRDAPPDSGLRDEPSRLRGTPSKLRDDPSRILNDAERERQREIARATAAKIDEIELEFASDMFDDEPAWGGNGRPSALYQDPGDQPDNAALPASAPAVEESAILYASGQAAAAEALLRDSLATFGHAERLPWWMLFDLYQAGGDEQAFESVAIDYASHFETSPPTWSPLPATPVPGAVRPAPGVATVETFDAALDANVAPRLRRVLESDKPLVRLDFGKVRSIDADGATAVLAALQQLRKSDRELVLAGVDKLLALLGPTLQIGVRQPSQAPWLLLLELLLLTNREKEFEESAMDYCVTYEVSPPQFEAPRRVSTAAPAPSQGDRFMLPSLVNGQDNSLLGAIDAYAEDRESLLLDCSRLARIDYAGAGALLARLDALAAAGHTVELRELNHLSAVLLRLLGAGDSVKLYPHRY